MLLFAFSSAVAVSEMYVYNSIGNFVNSVSEGNPKADLDGLPLFFLCIGFLFLFSKAVRGWLIGYLLMTNLAVSVRLVAQRVLLRRGNLFFRTRSPGEIEVKVSNLSTSSRDVIMESIDFTAYAVTYLIGVFVLFEGISYYLLIPTLVWIGIYSAVQIYASKKIRDYSENLAQKKALLSGVTVDLYRNYQTIKGALNLGFKDAIFNKSVDNSIVAGRNFFSLSALFELVSSTLNILLLFVNSFVLLKLMDLGLIGVGEVMLGFAITLKITELSSWFCYQVSYFFQSFGVIKNSIDILAPEENPTATLPFKAGLNSLSLHNISLIDGDRPVISEIDLEFSNSDKVLIKGPSGAGKSTLIKIIAGIDKQTSGCIKGAGGVLTTEQLNSIVSYVPQDNQLLNRTILENITFGVDGWSQADLEFAIVNSGVNKFLDFIVDENGASGLEALVGDAGSLLSGGQRQKILLARALLKRVDILVFDEPTSAFDVESEREFCDMVKEVLKDKLVIMTSHREALESVASKIINVKSGKADCEKMSF